MFSLVWNGTVEPDLDGENWLAPAAWRTASDTDNNYDLFLELRRTDCIDGREPATWVGALCGFVGAGVRLAVDTNALGIGAWKALLRSEAALVDELVGRGFLCDPRTGDLALLVSVDRQRLEDAFREEDFGEAMQPFALGLDRVYSSLSILERLVAAIRARSV